MADGAPEAAPRRVRVTLGGSKSNRVGVLSSAAGAESVVCHVCGGTGHAAGWIGASYVDCERMACYLCKRVGHTTQSCPFRIRPGDAAAGTAAEPAAPWAPAAGAGARGALPSRWRTRASLPAARAVGAGLDAPAAACRLLQHDVAPSPFRGREPPVWRVTTALLKLFKRRVSVLSFHPSIAGRLVSADKSGELCVWDFAAPRTAADTSRHVFPAHRWLVNALTWTGASPHAAITASADGTVRLLDLAARDWDVLVDVNPRGWTGDEANWRIFYAVSSPYGGGVASPVLAGDDVGRVWALDPLQRRTVIGAFQAHKRGAKVQSLHHNPVDAHAVASAGNDWYARVWDVRQLSWQRPASADFTEGGSGGTGAAAGAGTIGATPGDDGGGVAAATAEAGSGGVDDGAGAPRGGAAGRPNAAVATLPHPRVVNSAYWSPHTGTKLLTTCIDNRLRVYDFAADLEAPAQFVHSQDFARYLTPFRAVWDPKDARERLVACGRYISEAFDSLGGDAGGGTGAGKAIALHPIDVLDIGSATDGAGRRALPPSRVVSQLVDPMLSTICPVVAMHPTADVIACGSSRSVYVWRPFRRDRDPLRAASGGGAAPSGGPASRGGPSGDRHDDDSDDDGGGGGGGGGWGGGVAGSHPAPGRPHGGSDGAPPAKKGRGGKAASASAPSAAWRYVVEVAPREPTGAEGGDMPFGDDEGGPGGGGSGGGGGAKKRAKKG